MPKWTVYGFVPIDVVMTVEAETKEDAIDAAYQEFPGLTNYCGNGGTDKLVGVHDRNVSLDAGDAEPEFKDADPVDGHD